MGNLEAEYSFAYGLTVGDLFPFLADNGTTPRDNSCFSATEEGTVLGGVNFGGVPVVLLLDFIVFLVLLCLFSIIRRKLWDYGRLALVAESNGFNETSHRQYGRVSSCASDAEERDQETAREQVCCSWLPFVVRMDEDTIRGRCGSDAVHYLSFQRHLIALLVIICVMSVAIILPVNLSGNLLGNDPYSFGRTTIGNLQQDNHLLWLHTVFAVLYLILTVAVLRRHTSKIKNIRTDTDRRTLFVCSIPKEASEESIKLHFNEAYPNCRVSEVHLCYDVTKLMHLVKERKRSEKNLLYYQRVLEQQGTRELINPRLCGHLCCCVTRGCEQVDAIDFYSEQEARLLQEVKKQREEVPQHPLGLAFITLRTDAMAAYILKDFNALDCGGGPCGQQSQTSSESHALKVSHWRVSYAPHPKNIYWENLSSQGARWWLRCLLLNFFVFFLLFFLTTPSIIISTIDKFNVTKPIYYLNSAVVSQFFPTLLLWSFSALLPTVVYYSTLGESHWTRSGENRCMMHKLYIFLLFMVLILPSLGLTSLDFLFRWLFDTKFLSLAQMRFECVFLPDQGAFFVNYVIAAALVGSGMELLRLPGLLLYTVRMALANSAAERKYVKQNQAYEFEYGVMYGWTLCVFTVIMAYSITCPVIVPFALAAPIVCLLWLYFFSVLRTGFGADTSLFTFVVLCVTIFICISYSCFGHFRYLSPHSYNVKEDGLDGGDEAGDEVSEEASRSVYLPRVLQSSPPLLAPSVSAQRQSYGAVGGNSPPCFTGTEPDRTDD
ncbi:hypothetical protein AAFF_G00241930 [Aldrovandia affinis]|uniref:Transmembrane protein 63A n=1 Tax=Aldrovandia affinis TaxID=143900 RepID=A0AAD7SUR7_9TELE|nr:hypothetical protein AAFF_G00241930 [Aldrovandia affinis]